MTITITQESVLGKLDSKLFFIPEAPSTEGVTSQEVTNSITEALNQSCTELKLNNVAHLPDTDYVREAVATFAAGLLWNKKISTEAPNYAEDKKGETFGDKKISEAKAMLNAIDNTVQADNRVSINMFTVTSEDFEDEDI